MFSVDNKDSEVFEESNSDEPEETVQEEPAQETVQETVKASPSGHFQGLGEVDRVDTIPGHIPQGKDESIEGRYARVIFTIASKQNLLWHVYNDLEFLGELHRNVDFFKNSGLSVNNLKKLTESLQETGGLQDVTIKFLEVLCQNQRLTTIGTIVEKYHKFYASNREEKIRIISAYDLNASEKDEVLAALKHSNADKVFILDFEIDESIQGGLQMYTESRFMDMSLKSRIDKITGIVNKI